MDKEKTKSHPEYNRTDFLAWLENLPEKRFCQNINKYDCGCPIMMYWYSKNILPDSGNMAIAVSADPELTHKIDKFCNNSWEVLLPSQVISIIHELNREEALHGQS